MTIPKSSSAYTSIDLAASAARVGAARRLAAEQAEAVAACKGGANDRSIDLLFLLQESVLVFDETHTVLTRLATNERLRNVTADDHAGAEVATSGRGRRRLLVVAMQIASFLVVLSAAAVLVEIVDPAPMDVQAVGAGPTAATRR